MKNKILPIAETAILIALAVVLELLSKTFFNFVRMPNGGSFSIAMVAIVAIGFRRGAKYSIPAGIIFGFINFLIDGYGLHWGSLFFDYLAAFGAYGICGFFKKYRNNIGIFTLAILLAGTVRYMFHGFSGVLFFADTVPAEYAGHIWFYSFVAYNLMYNLSSTIVSMVISIILHKQLFLFLKDEKWG